MTMFYIKLTSLNDFPLEEVPVSPTGQFKQSPDSFYVTDSPLSVTSILQTAMFYTKMTSLNDFPIEEGPIVQMVSLNKVLTVSVLQIVL